jgi:hypothetical protein
MTFEKFLLMFLMILAGGLLFWVADEFIKFGRSEIWPWTLFVQ